MHILGLLLLLPCCIQPLPVPPQPQLPSPVVGWALGAGSHERFASRLTEGGVTMRGGARSIAYASDRGPVISVVLAAG